MDEMFCMVCGIEPVATDGRCRDCDIDYLMETWPTCECGAKLLSDVARRLGMEELHEASCPGRKRKLDDPKG